MEGVSPIDEKKMTGTQQRIIDAALHLISQVGYKSTTTKLIAQEAEVNETTIFKNFKSKEALMNVAFKQHANQIKEEVDSFFQQEFENSRDLLKRTGHFIQDTYEKHRYVVIGSIKEVGNEKAKTIFNYKQEYINAALSEKLQEFPDADHFCQKDYETISFIYNNAIVALLLQKIQQNGEQKKSAITLENIIDMTLRPFDEEQV
ncbi:TetR/AcrR family transcriptional regulator [Carnobacterium maltaromaticum]|jgi:AcrR family transcriptional regulator|uniref:Bacterial regulatory s, tetR family protein n=3 Tax=Carnobacteriaceae TaxID=186828 RepID=K8EI61_CARML|nr:TetR/AcrR family transcriptional regulator [Carnobacterium maltaromaticum]CCO11518.2 bacterial regulatory s, tetR family protein [Carnobacterium maltaromaticum LMA28]AOA02340.1 TetR family transcriptional regulator [Carnobacterium maltaromaticum]KRN60038.1 transcriptional regulator [Carnobacterium maltaromaticum DSM 20342]KRN73477.1 transcriptional regulator [Carnobacterium maltaromaticum]KRN85334.1 transcriptional regulator [Carnobacterium maltaromaticum]